MTIIKKMFLIIFFMQSHLFAEIVSIPQDSIVISLGPDCEAALYLRQFQLRKAAFPFDWLRSYNFEKICFAISEKMANFLNNDFLIKKYNLVHNVYYDFEFVHDFPTVAYPYILPENGNNGVIIENYLDFLSQVKEKYQARLDRFLNVLGGDTFVVFFRTHITPNQAKLFTSTMNFHFPNLKYKLVVIHDKKDLNYEWNILNVRNFYIFERDPKSANRWFHEDEWKKIFIKLGFLA